MHLATLFLAAIVPAALGAENSSTPGAPGQSENPNAFLSAQTPTTRADWQKRLTLGPGDILNLSLFEIDGTRREGVPISPDGRITFLQARDIMAAGLTVDELRATLDTALAKFYQSPRSVVIPAAINSKKYLVLGSVVNSGVFPFDRPMTIIEAIARAGGLETGLADQKSVELADLSHSFMVRNRQRMPVDFERLFQRGDLSQNIALEPDDYLFFASSLANEIYVLGEVANPGVVSFSPKPTVLNVIASRGGYTQRAFQGRVLVVRGSLDHPQTFVVDTRAVLKGEAPDFKLQPKDIVYVSTNPWKIGAEVVDTALRSFVQGFMVETTNLKVGPVFNWPKWGNTRTEPLIK
jgi:protein involved in polysaccharide export with SLBB domain